MPPRRILVIAEGQLGDLLLLTPALRALKTSFRESSLHLLVVERHPASEEHGEERPVVWRDERSVLDGNPHVDDVHMVDRASLKRLKGIRRLHSELDVVRHLRSLACDTVVCTFPEDRFVLWSYLSGASTRVGQRQQALAWLLTHRPTLEKRAVGVLRYYCGLAESIGAKVDSYRTEYVVRSEARAKALDVLKGIGLDPDAPIIAIHPGATGDYKIWPPERYAALLGILHRDGWRQLLLLGSERDAEVLRSLNDFCGIDGIPRMTQLIIPTIAQFAAVLERCTLCISNDSGPRHLAIAVGTPSLALFRQHHDREWAVYDEGPAISTLKGEGQCPVCPQGVCLDRIPAGEKFGSYCLRFISPELVFTRASEMLKGNSWVRWA